MHACVAEDFGAPLNFPDKILKGAMAPLVLYQSSVLPPEYADASRLAVRKCLRMWQDEEVEQNLRAAGV